MGAELELAADPTPPIPRLCRYLSERSPQPMVAVEGTTHVVSYLNPAFARLVGKESKDLVGRPFAEAVPEGEENGCLALLDRVYRTGVPENLAEQEHRHTPPGPAYWSYAVWAILGEDDLPAGVMIQVTDSTETALFRQQAAAMNEALLLSSVRQHELGAAAESLNARLEERVAERTAELAAANASLRAEIGMRVAAEAERLDLLRRLATAQEDERRRIARNLHDQMGQLLTALGLGLKALEAAIPDPSSGRPQLAGLRELTDRIGREFHQLALDLRPTALDDLGLQAALANYAEAWSERSGVAVDFQSTVPDNHTDDERATWQYGIYRPANNAFGTAVRRHEWGARVTGLPVYRDDGRVLVHVGLGTLNGELVQNQLRVRARPVLRNGPGFANPVLVDTGNVNGSRQYTVAPEFAAVLGSWTFQAEWTGQFLTQATPSGKPNQGTVLFHGGYAEVLYFLTGEHQTYDKAAGAFGRVVPNRNLRMKRGEGCSGCGAWQIGARFSYLDLNDKAIQGGTVYDWTVGVNWFWNPNMKVQLNYILEHRDQPGVNPAWINGVGVRGAYDF